MNTTVNGKVLELVNSDPALRSLMQKRLQAQLAETNAQAKQLQEAIDGLAVAGGTSAPKKTTAKTPASTGTTPAPTGAKRGPKAGSVNPEGKTGRVLAWVKAHPGTGAAAIVEAFAAEIKRPHVHTILNKLQKGGHLVRSGERNHGTYT